MSYAAMNSRYREMEVLAMSPAQRLVLLYAHLLVQLRQARTLLERGDIEARTERMIRAGEIVHQLATSLNRESGGVLAARLSDLYAWMLGELARIQARPDLAKLDAVIQMVADLHSAWEGAAEQVAATP